ncbi:hypothetical protein E4J89_11160 [Arthrobacter sp. CAU 1506]|uniref:hypothetical protein n=1 Tax=Arthrobacter sp. CAU 1506 TaxID=2560052 RepID=UPI0010AC94A7|nr:hypothetical protein [Arthrobacter sp. CAU 1506]TJY69472.1 hypothetical protein E4J89_11160 [Arthrobacter sp. CAU 1506]
MAFWRYGRRISDLEAQLGLLAVSSSRPPASQQASISKTSILSIVAILISITAVVVPWLQNDQLAKETLEAERRAAIGPILNDVAIAERKLWAAKEALRATVGGSDAAVNGARAMVSEMMTEYLDATYQVVPHAELEELVSMNNLTRALMFGDPSQDGAAGTEITQAQIDQYEDASSAFQRTFKCSVNPSVEEKCLQKN